MFSSLGYQAAEAFRSTGVSQSEFSKISGIDQSHLSKLLNGKRRWNEDWLQKFNAGLKALGYDPVVIGGPAPDQALPPPVHPDVLARYEKRERDYEEREKWLREMVDDLKREVAELKKARAAHTGTLPEPKSPEATVSGNKV